MHERQRIRPLVNLQNSGAYDTKNNQIFQRAVQILKYIMTNAPKSIWHTKSRDIILKSSPINQYGDTPVTKSGWTAEMTFQH